MPPSMTWPHSTGRFSLRPMPCVFSSGAWREKGLDARAFGRCQICAVGPKTAAALAPFGLRADLIPGDYKAEGVVAVFRQQTVTGRRILFPHADRAREVIPAELARLGAEVVTPVAYRNTTPEALPEELGAELADKRIDCMTFSSSSTVSNLARMAGTP